MLETTKTWQLNATHDTKSDPFATKDISGMIDEMWIGHRDYRVSLLIVDFEDYILVIWVNGLTNKPKFSGVIRHNISNLPSNGSEKKILYTILELFCKLEIIF